MLIGTGLENFKNSIMESEIIYIENPYKGLLDLVRKLQADKDASQAEIKSNWNNYFKNHK